MSYHVVLSFFDCAFCQGCQGNLKKIGDSFSVSGVLDVSGFFGKTFTFCSRMQRGATGYDQANSCCAEGRWDRPRPSLYLRKSGLSYGEVICCD